MRLCRLPIGFAMVMSAAVVSGGCHPAPAPTSVATMKAEDLPSDPAELAKRADELSQAHNRVSLENAMVVCDRILAMKPEPKAAYAANWMGARAAFYLADEAEGDNDRRAYFGRRGMGYADRAIALDGKSVEGLYYRALDRGYLASTKTIGALDMVGDIAKDAKAAMAADEKFDHGGPLRVLGALLVKAPGWPTSVGDKEEGLDDLKKSVEVAPDHPLNRLYYGEALIENGKKPDAVTELEESLKLVQAPAWAYMKARVEKEAKEQLEKARK